VIEDEMGIAVYPNTKTGWHYDYKIAQSYLLKVHNIPTPKTWIWYDRDIAKKWSIRQKTSRYLNCEGVKVQKTCN
jgi:hypothetical protein